MIWRWVRNLARHTLSEIERKALVEAIQDREAAIRRRNGVIKNLHHTQFVMRGDLRRIKDAFQPEYDRILTKYGSFEAARAYCDSLEGIPPELMDWYRDAQARWGTAKWWKGEKHRPPEPPSPPPVVLNGLFQIGKIFTDTQGHEDTEE